MRGEEPCFSAETWRGDGASFQGHLELLWCVVPLLLFAALDPGPGWTAQCPLQPGSQGSRRHTAADTQVPLNQWLTQQDLHQLPGGVLGAETGSLCCLYCAQSWLSQGLQALHIQVKKDFFLK